jgi:hypothetical protein
VGVGEVEVNIPVVAPHPQRVIPVHVFIAIERDIELVAVVSHSHSIYFGLSYNPKRR